MFRHRTWSFSECSAHISQFGHNLEYQYSACMHRVWDSKKSTVLLLIQPSLNNAEADCELKITTFNASYIYIYIVFLIKNYITTYYAWIWYGFVGLRMEKREGCCERCKCPSLITSGREFLSELTKYQLHIMDTAPWMYRIFKANYIILCFFLHRTLWYNYVTHNKEKQNFSKIELKH